MPPIDPIKALFWSAIVNGFVAVPVMAAMMWVATQRDSMGRFVANLFVRVLGWGATLIMTAAAASMLVFR